MPWKMSDAPRHTHRAKSAKSKEAWSAIANAVLKKTGGEASAIRIANSVVKKQKGKGKK